MTAGEMGGATAPCEVVVAVVTHNSAPVIEGLLESLPAGLAGVSSWQLIVVDNASSDGTPEIVEAAQPRAVVIRSAANAGYAAGINTAVRTAGDYDSVLVLNPDVRLTRGSVQRLRRTLAQPGVGIVAPRLERGDGTLILSMRREATVLRALGAAVLGGTRAGRHEALGDVVTDERCYDTAASSDWVSGPALLISGECMRTAGPWDERFFLYSEEADFALRARDLGFAVRYEPDARVVHLEGESHGNPALWSLLVLNRVWLFRRRNGLLRSVGYWLATLLGEVLRARRSAVHRAAVRALLTPAVLGPPAGASRRLAVDGSVAHGV